MDQRARKQGTVPVRAVTPAVEVSVGDVQRLRSLYEQGLVRQALDLALTFGPLPAWVGARAQIMAGRIAVNLGAPRLGRWLHHRAYQSEPTAASSQAYFMSAVLDRFGPVTGLRWFRRLPTPTHGDEGDDGRQYLLSLRARAHAALRDFDQAEAYLAEAEALDPRSPWIWTERASLLEDEDRYEEALAAARHSLELREWYRPGIQETAHLLQVLDRDEEAVELLQEASRRFESVPVLSQLAMLQIDLERYADARRSLEAIAGLSPILEGPHQDWLTAQRARVEYQCGDLEGAARHARALDDEYYRDFAARMTAPEAAAGRRRVRLPVDFVRQHHLTCAPATLAALSRFWGRPAEHLAVAEVICHDGTPAHSERHWADTNGWATREFTVTWDAAVALLDRGVPFTLTTTEATSGHLQAVTGYDSLRRTLRIRDPFQYYSAEAIADPFLERYRAHGPRGMAMVPRDRRELLDGLALPDADRYDRLYEVQRALFEHRRADAAAVCARMTADSPGHRLTLTARRSVAAYDENTVEVLAALDELRRLYLEDGNLRLARLSCLRELGRREDRLAMLAEISGGAEVDPVFCRLYADELSADARRLDEAAYWCRRALRHRPVDGGNLSVQADLLWARREFAEAAEFYRLAACVDDKREQPARAYFTASRHLKQTDRALALLQRRVDRYGRKSGGPAVTLHEALAQLDETPRALAVLEQAMALRPDDGELRLFSARALARWGRLEPAERLLESARDRAPEIAVLRTAAEIAGLRTDATEALSLWRRVLELDPLAMDAHRAVASLLAETAGIPAAVGHLAAASARFPHHYALYQVQVHWLQEESIDAAEPVLRRMVEIHPADGWAQRELALNLGRQGKLEEALRWAESARQLDPTSPGSHSVRGSLRLRQGDGVGARADFQEALRLSIDHDYAVTALMRTCGSLEERRDALSFIERELIRQTVFGEGLLAFREVARGIQPPEELLTSLRKALAARPDLWHAWSAVVLQLADLQRLDEAAHLAAEATERFPLLPRLWLDRALVHQVRLEPAEEVRCLRQALEINPAYSLAAQRLSSALERAGDFAAARKVVENACVQAPMEAGNHGYVADLLWKMGERAAACDRLEQALRLQPEYDWAWRTLRAWSVELQQPTRPVQLARALAARRAGESRSWLILAENLMQTPHRDELAAALDKAIALQPRQLQAYELKAQALVEQERFEEALAVCRPAAWPEGPPIELRARAAWVEAERGDLKAAIAQMNAVVAEHPGHVWGWQQLAEWQWNAGHHEDAIAAAQKLAEFNPVNPAPLGYVADLKLKNGDRAGARKDLERAMALDPAYAFSGMSLFDLELEDGNLAAARRVLAVLEQQVGGVFVEARAAQLAAREGRVTEAETILERLCTSPTTRPWPIQSTVAALDQAGRARSADQVLRAALAKPDATPVLGEIWIRRETGRSRWFQGRLLRRLMARGEMGRRALSAWIEAFGDAAPERPGVGAGVPILRELAFRRLLRRYGTELKADDDCWGTVGYTLACLRRPAAVVRWLAGWRDHPNVRPWMLSNLARALRDLGRDAEADEVCRGALQLPVRDHTTNDFALWLAMEQLLSGDPAEAAAAGRSLDGWQEADVTSGMRRVLALGKAVLAVVRSEPADRPAVLREQQRLLDESVAGGMAGASRSVRRLFRRCMTRMAREGGGWRLRFWGWRKLYLPA